MENVAVKYIDLVGFLGWFNTENVVEASRPVSDRVLEEMREMRELRDVGDRAAPLRTHGPRRPTSVRRRDNFRCGSPPVI